MDWLEIILIAIVIIGILEGIYLLIKSRKEKSGFEGEEKEEIILRIKVWDALKLGFGFCLGVLLILALLVLLGTILKQVGLFLPLSLSSLI